MTPTSEVRRIRAHLAQVESELREKSNLGARAAHLERLRAYIEAERFPRNLDAGHRVPVFIDDRGHRCAVAELLVCDGREPLARRIADRMKNHLVEDMVDAELLEWAAGSGLELDELAAIQPTYAPPGTMECAADCVVCETPASRAYEWDGQHLKRMPSSVGEWTELMSLATSPDKTVWGLFSKTKHFQWQGPSSALIARWNGKAWVDERDVTSHSPRAMLPLSRDDVWLYGASTVHDVRTNGVWESTKVESGSETRGQTRLQAWGTPDDVWFAGDAYRRDALHVVKGVATTVHFSRDYAFDSVNGREPSDVWFVGSRFSPTENPGPMHWDGATMKMFPFKTRLQTVFPVAANDAWFGGGDALAHWKDGSLQSYALDGGGRYASVVSMAGSGASDIWAVGARFNHGAPNHPGFALHWDGTRWRSLPSNDAELLLVLSTGRNRAWFLADGCERWKPDKACEVTRANACTSLGRTVNPFPVPVGDPSVGSVVAAPLVPLADAPSLPPVKVASDPPGLPPAGPPAIVPTRFMPSKWWLAGVAGALAFALTAYLLLRARRV